MLSIVASEQAEQDALKLDLDALVLEGARRMLVAALKAEVDQYIADHAEHRDAAGHALVVRNGLAEPRSVTTAAGALEIQAPRVHDRREGRRFTSAILPPWARRSPKVTEVLPVLYLRGISTKDFEPALAEFFGSEAGLSASTIQRLTREWGEQLAAFQRRDLSQVDYVYLWADGVHFNIRLEHERLCCLVLIGVRADGRKELVAVGDGYRESTESWSELLRDLKRRGMRAPLLASGDGALGFWGALREVFPDSREQRCWVHKIANVLDAVPSSLQPKVKAALHNIMNAENKEAADIAIDQFQATYAAKYPKAGGQGAQGSRGPVDPLRLSGRALDSSTDNERHRVNIRHGPIADEQNKGSWQSERRIGDGLQTARRGPGPLALCQCTPPGRTRSR
jgi:transposase-like protein